MPSPTKRSLDDFFSDLPPTAIPQDHADAVLDSSSDTSDIDEPKDLNEIIAGPSTANTTPLPIKSAIGGGVRAAYQPRPHSIISDRSVPPKKPVVESTVGWGGKRQFVVTSDPQDAAYFAVQW